MKLKQSTKRGTLATLVQLRIESMGRLQEAQKNLDAIDVVIGVMKETRDHGRCGRRRWASGGG